MQRPAGEPPVGPTPGSIPLPGAGTTPCADARRINLRLLCSGASMPSQFSYLWQHRYQKSLTVVDRRYKHKSGSSRFAWLTCVRDALVDLQWWNGHEQRRRPFRSRLANYIRLQHVPVSGFEMGRWNFVRTYPSPDGFVRRVSYHHSRGLALALARIDNGCGILASLPWLPWLCREFSAVFALPC